MSGLRGLASVRGLMLLERPLDTISDEANHPGSSSRRARAIPAAQKPKVAERQVDDTAALPPASPRLCVPAEAISRYCSYRRRDTPRSDETMQMIARTIAGDLPTPKGLEKGLTATLGPNRALPTPSLPREALEWPPVSPRGWAMVRGRSGGASVSRP